MEKFLLSQEQTAVFMECKGHPERTTYNLPLLGKLPKDVDPERLKQAILLAAQEDGRALLDADRAEPCEPASPEARARLFAAVERAKKPSAARHRFTPAAKRTVIAVAAAAVALVVIFASPGQGGRMDGLSETASPSE